MCLPLVPMLAIGAAVATTAIGQIAQAQAVNAHNRSLQTQHDVKQEEIDEATTAALNERMRQARREQGRIMVAAGESGLNTSSPVVDALISDVAMQATLANQQSLANRESRKKATTAEANAMMKSKPTLLGAGLQIGLSGASAALPFSKELGIGRGS